MSSFSFKVIFLIEKVGTPTIANCLHFHGRFISYFAWENGDLVNEKMCPLFVKVGAFLLVIVLVLLIGSVVL